MLQRIATALEPRKSPVQARSTASVEAILVATAQVLLRVGKERLTTTLVAARAGVSVGTLYQYFPNKSALLQAALARHLEYVAGEMDRVCREQRGNSLQAMATALIDAFLDAKMRDPKQSAAFFAVSADIDGAGIAKKTRVRINQAIVDLLATASGHGTKDPELTAAVMQSAMSGVIHRVLEAPAPERQLATMRAELHLLVNAYLKASAEAAFVGGL